MSSEKPNFLSQPVVKNLFMYRNGDPYYEARRVVINQKRVCNFETLLREVTAGIQPPFGAVRNIYTPRGGHKVDCLESLQSGEQYVAAGRERFRRLDYLQIGSRKKRMLQTLPMQAKPLPPNRIIVSARFLKPIKEPCTIFVVANGDILDPALRLLVHQRMLAQFDRILEMITEKMGLRVLGGVRSLYTYEGQQVTEGNQLESGQLYVAVGRERFKKLPYSDLLFTKPRGTRRAKGMKAYSLPPIYRYSKQSGNGKSIVRSSDSGEGEPKASPPSHSGNNKEHLSSIVREISQARLLSFRKRKSGQSLTLSTADNDDLESKGDDGNPEGKTNQDQPSKQKLDADDTKAAEENGEKAEEKEGAKEEETSASKDDKKENPETNAENVEVKKEKEEVIEESKEGVKRQEPGSSSTNSDKSQDSKENEDGNHTSSEGGKEQDKTTDEEKQDKDGGEGEKGSESHVNDVDTGEKEKETENSKEPGKTQSDNETKEKVINGSSSRDVNREEDVSKVKDEATKEPQEENKVNGEVSTEDDEVESEAELNMDQNNAASSKEAAEIEEKEMSDKSKK